MDLSYNNRKTEELRPGEDMTYYFHFLSKDKKMGGKVDLSVDSSLWPKEWRKVVYKKYNKSKKIKLSPISDCRIDEGFTSLLEKRKSVRTFAENMHNITLQEISILVTNSISLKRVGDENSRRYYPSPGGLYPNEVYIYINRSKEIPFGVYHYNFLEHSLELINDNFSNESIKFGGESWFTESAATILITTVFSRITQKYGERGYRYSLLEAGHIGQNIYLTATAKNLKVCGCGGIVESEIERILFIDGKDECCVYAISIG